jgi:hypothetical protein
LPQPVGPDHQDVLWAAPRPSWRLRAAGAASGCAARWRRRAWRRSARRCSDRARRRFRGGRRWSLHPEGFSRKAAR